MTIAAAADPYAGFEAARDASTFGMWVFLVTEVMFFGALFGAYTLIRMRHAPGFAAGSRLTDVLLGGLNTAVLLTSSLTIALAGHVARSRDPRLHGRRKRLLLIATMVLGACFLAIKGVEYHHDFDQHLVPGPGFAFDGPDRSGVVLFFWFYFFATGFHAVHMIIGLGLVGTAVWLSDRQTPAQSAHRVELTALYWHFVDVVWIFLFPLLYLVSRT